MAAWVDSPIVSFSRDGRVVELGRSGESPALHLHGSTGLGLAPVDIKSSERLSGDGSIVRGVRYGVRDVYVPLLLSGTELSVAEARRDLTRLLAPHLGPVDVRIEDPVTGTDRMIRGYLRDGMEGDFGTDFGRSWHRLGLTFECPDPWWLGPEQVVELRVNPGSKPFVSETVDFFPVMLAQSTVQGEFQVDILGDGPVWPSWQVTGPGVDLTISNGQDVIEISGEFDASSPVLIETGPGRITPDRWADLSLRSRLFSLEPGRQTLTVTLVGASTDTLVRLTYQERFLEGV